MKVGLRTPSLKKSLKARTTGKFKRKMKKAVNPFYGKKGMGYLKNPSRAFKNKVYHKTTIGVNDIAKKSVSFHVSKGKKEIIKSDKSYLITLALVIFLGWCGAHDFYVGKIGKGVIKLFTFNFILFGWLLDFIAVLFFAYEDSNGYSIWRMLPAKKEEVAEEVEVVEE